MANAGVVLGAERHDPGDVDLRWVGAIVSKNDEVEETGLGAGVLNDPVTGILWLVHRLAQYGMGLSAGEVLLAGSFLIGAITGQEGLKELKPFTIVPFTGILCLFLLDMGLSTGRSLVEHHR